MSFEKKPEAPAKVEPSQEKVSYFRTRKISNYLYEILEVEIDESVIQPVVDGKQDTRELIMDRIHNLICPRADFKRKKSGK